MTLEEMREVIERYCMSKEDCEGCPLINEPGTCWGNSTDIERNYEVLIGTASSLREEILLAAKEAVCGQRHDDYGSVENNFKLIGDLWSTYLGHEIKPVDVAMCMALLKIARIKTGKGTQDSFIDLAGYAACGAEVVTHE